MNIENMTVKELIEKMQAIPHDGNYTWVVSFSPTGLGLRRHYKGSSQDDTRKVRKWNSLTRRSDYVESTLEDIEKGLKKAEIQMQITSLKKQLKEI